MRRRAPATNTSTWCITGRARVRRPSFSFSSGILNVFDIWSTLLRWRGWVVEQSWPGKCWRHLWHGIENCHPHAAGVSFLCQIQEILEICRWQLLIFLWHAWFASDPRSSLHFHIPWQLLTILLFAYSSLVTRSALRLEELTTTDSLTTWHFVSNSLQLYST